MYKQLRRLTDNLILSCFILFFAIAIHEEAKLRVDSTEEKLKSGDCDFDKGLQEVLNVAILKVSYLSS